MLNDRQLGLIRKVVLRMNSTLLPDIRAKDYEATLEGRFKYMSHPVLSNFPCAPGEHWEMEREDQGEAGRRLTFTR